MPRRSGVRLSVAAVLAATLSACIFFPFPPSPGSELVVENTTDSNWVLRLVAASYPQDVAIPAGETGTAILYAGAPSNAVLLDSECTEVDELEWTDATAALRIESDGRLTAIDEPPPDEDRQVLLEYYQCASRPGAAPEAGAAVAGARGTILLLGGDGSGWRIDPATAELTRIVASGQAADPTDLALDAEHTLSPDGSMLAFTRYSQTYVTSDLFVADADGSAERMLVEGAGTPTWSPDGTRIAYLNLDPFSGGAGLNVIDLDGGEPVEVGENASAASWSPDGQQLAFIASDPGAFMLPTVEPSELRVASVDGSGVRTLAEAAPFGSHPAWSPDGSRIAFMSGTEFETTIAVVDAAGGEVVTLAQIDGSSVSEPVWSPDGTVVAFTIMSAGLLSTEGAIGMVAADGGEVRRIGELGNAYYVSPRWSPDGARLATARGGTVEVTSDLVVFDAGSGTETILATDVLGLIEWRD